MKDCTALANRLIAIGEREGGEMFLGKPDRWYRHPSCWRCVNDHVSTYYLKSEAQGGALCLECYQFVLLTFPEDKDGPLIDPKDPDATR